MAVNFPGGVGVPQQQRQLLSDLNLLVPHVWKQFVERYGDQNYYLILEMMGAKEMVPGQLFEHFESYGKLQDAVSVNAAVAAPAAGADVTFTLSAADHAQSGTLDAGRVGDVVRIDSSGVEGKIVSISTAVASAHTWTVRPLKSTQAFASTSGNLDAAEVVKIVGRTDMGEASDKGNTNVRLTQRIQNRTTQIREDYSTSDLAMMEQIFFEYDGQQYIKNKGIDETTRRFINSIEFKLIQGDTANNLSALGGSLGTQGLIPAVRERGQTHTYTAGSLGIPDIHTISRLILFNGGTNNYHWLSDIYQRQEIDDSIFTTYNNGAIRWYDANNSQDRAKVGYGFSSWKIDDIVFDLKLYRPFNSETVYGKASASSEFRNFGLLIPQGQFLDTKTAVPYKNLSVVSNTVPNAIFGDKDVHTVSTGMFAPAGVSGQSSVTTKAELNVSMICYKGLRVAGGNQFILVKGN